MSPPPVTDGRVRPLSVRLVTRLFPPEVGAAAFRQRHLADAFVRAGHAVEVLTSKPPSGTPPAADGGLRIRRWPVLRDAGGNVRGYLQYLSFDLPLLVRNLRRRPDLYVVEPPPTTGAIMRLVAALQRRPYVWYAADIWSDAAGSAGAPKILVAVVRAVERHVLRHAVTVLSISPDVTVRLAGMGVDPSRITTVGNGVDTEVFTPDGPVDKSPAGPYLAYTGTMSEWQGAGVFIDALHRHRSRGGSLRMVFLGQGSELTALRRLADRIVPGAVDFLGVVPPAHAATVLRGAAAGLVSIKPGLGYDFAVPTKIFAATGTGTPVIFAGHGAGAELVAREELGWACEYTREAVGRAFDAAEQAATDGRAPERRERLAAWTREHRSLAAKAAEAVAEISALVRAPHG